MNEKDDSAIVQRMILFVEEKEREYQAAKLGKNSKTKAVADIQRELERQIKNAD